MSSDKALFNSHLAKFKQDIADSQIKDEEKKDLNNDLNRIEEKISFIVQSDENQTRLKEILKNLVLLEGDAIMIDPTLSPAFKQVIDSLQVSINGIKQVTIESIQRRKMKEAEKSRQEEEEARHKQKASRDEQAEMIQRCQDWEEERRSTVAE